MTVGVVAKMSAKPGKEKEFADALNALAEQVNANEPGCIMYEAFQDMTDATVFWMLEKYETVEDMEAHGKSAHFKAAGPSFAGCMAGPPEVTRLNKA